MKKVNLNGKLNLGKETISKLNEGLLSDIKGGGPNSKISCLTVCGVSCQVDSCYVTCAIGLCATVDCNN